MPDISTISTILGSVKTATEIAKLLKNSDLSFEKAEMKLKLAELISALADAKMEVSVIQELILQKDLEIRQLQEKIDTQEKMTFEKPYYWKINGAEKEGPFCQHCYDKDGKIVQLQDGENGCWNCTICKNIYLDKNYIEPSGPEFYGDDY